MAALEEMEQIRWETVAEREAGVFSGGPAAVAAYWGDEKNDESAASLEIWMSPDCYPLRVNLQAGDAVVLDWELFDLGTEIVFEIPEDTRS